MIWLVGNKGMLGQDVENILKREKLKYCASDRETDITDLKKIKEFTGNKDFRYIINCSGYTNVDLAEIEQDLAYSINSAGVKNLALTAKENNSILIHISTDYVFDGKAKIPYKEDAKVNPLSMYGKSKLDGEVHIKENLKKYFILRTAWMYGKDGKNFVLKMINLFQKKDKISVVNDQCGTPTYTIDLAEIILKIIKDNFDCYGIYHFTNEGSASRYEFTREIYRLAQIKGLIKKKILIKPVKTSEYPVRAFRPKYSVLSNEKIKKHLGISIRKWQEALEEFLEGF